MLTNTISPAPSSPVPLLRPDFERRAQGIIEFIHEHRANVGLPEALTLAWERYVEPETNVDLRRFSEVIADARRQATIQRQLDDDRERLHSGQLSHEQRVEVGHHYETLRHQACIYNHLLRGVIECHRDQFDRQQLTDWLATSSQGVRKWAVGEITGTLSEVTLHAALMGLPELSGVRYASVEDDLKGYDFVMAWQGKLVTIDAKTGLYAPLREYKHGHLHLEVSVPREAIENFHITRHGLDIVRREIRQALNGAMGVRRLGTHYRTH